MAQNYKVDGATLKAYNSSGWRGIEVWGAATYEKKAKAILRNVLITQAYCGVATYHYNGPFPTGMYNNPPDIEYKEKRGGIVRAENCTFLNNNYGVDLVGTESADIIYNIPANAQSYFKLCDFIINAHPPFPLSIVALANQLGIVDKSGVNVLGCNFKDNWSHFSQGISILNSDVRIAPAAAFTFWGNFGVLYSAPTTFDGGMYFGINYNGNSSMRRLVVDNNTITKCNFGGINTDNANYPLLINNNISSCYAGISMFWSTGYEVTQNRITNNGADDGINIYKSGESFNWIYNNKITNCGAALHPNDVNRAADPLGSGLKFICNDMHNNTVHNGWDINVEALDTPYYTQGIAGYQGYVTVTLPYNGGTPVMAQAAGNSFDPIKSYANLNIDNDPLAAPFVYVYYNNGYADEYPAYRNVPVITGEKYECVSLYPDGKGIGKVSFLYFQQKLSLIEAGITELLEQTSYSLNDSLSLEGLRTMQQQLVDSTIRGYLYADSIVHYDSIAMVLEQVRYGWTNKVSLAKIYATQHLYDSAIAILNNIPTTYGLTTYQAEDVGEMVSMYQVLDTLLHNNDKWSLVPDSMKDRVKEVALSNKGCYGAPIAHYIRYRYLNILSPQDSIPPFDTTLFQGYSYNNASNNDPEGYFKLMPNPAHDILNVEWSGQHNENTAVLELVNASGKKCLTQEIYPGITPINISNLPSGIYFAVIRQNGKRVFYQKVILK